MGENLFQHALNIFVTSIFKFLQSVETDVSCFNSSSKDDVLTMYNRHKHLSCKWLILLFIIRVWNIQIRGQ